MGIFALITLASNLGCSIRLSSSLSTPIRPWIGCATVTANFVVDHDGSTTATATTFGIHMIRIVVVWNSDLTKGVDMSGVELPAFQSGRSPEEVSSVLDYLIRWFVPTTTLAEEESSLCCDSSRSSLQKILNRKESNQIRWVISKRWMMSAERSE